MEGRDSTAIHLGDAAVGVPSIGGPWIALGPDPGFAGPVRDSSRAGLGTDLDIDGGVLRCLGFFDQRIRERAFTQEWEVGCSTGHQRNGRNTRGHNGRNHDGAIEINPSQTRDRDARHKDQNDGQRRHSVHGRILHSPHFRWHTICHLSPVQYPQKKNFQQHDTHDSDPGIYSARQVQRMFVLRQSEGFTGQAPPGVYDQDV